MKVVVLNRDVCFEFWHLSDKTFVIRIPNLFLLVNSCWAWLDRGVLVVVYLKSRRFRCRIYFGFYAGRRVYRDESNLVDVGLWLMILNSWSDNVLGLFFAACTDWPVSCKILVFSPLLCYRRSNSFKSEHFGWLVLASQPFALFFNKVLIFLDWFISCPYLLLPDFIDLCSLFGFEICVLWYSEFLGALIHQEVIWLCMLEADGPATLCADRSWSLCRWTLLRPCSSSFSLLLLRILI